LWFSHNGIISAAVFHSPGIDTDMQQDPRSTDFFRIAGSAKNIFIDPTPPAGNFSRNRCSIARTTHGGAAEKL
jgi:hypothetical protein